MFHFNILPNRQEESIITRNDIWVYEFTPETKQQSMKTQPSACKIMTTMFWDSEGLVPQPLTDRDDCLKDFNFCTMAYEIRQIKASCGWNIFVITNDNSITVRICSN
ncbi:hypothetical protein Trydic_g20819 [Trypoxylus dichotomus]